MRAHDILFLLFTWFCAKIGHLQKWRPLFTSHLHGKLDICGCDSPFFPLHLILCGKWDIFGFFLVNTSFFLVNCHIFFFIFLLTVGWTACNVLIFIWSVFKSSTAGRERFSSNVIEMYQKYEHISIASQLSIYIWLWLFVFYRRDGNFIYWPHMFCLVYEKSYAFFRSENTLTTVEM